MRVYFTVSGEHYSVSVGEEQNVKLLVEEVETKVRDRLASLGIAEGRFLTARITDPLVEELASDVDEIDLGELGTAGALESDSPGFIRH